MDKNMDSTELNWTLHPKQHQRVIVHIDIDCFYAQVEMVRNPELRNKPMGVKQKYLMVTSNYIARALGVKKQMYVTEAMKVLPELILIDGSDLTPYRQYSNEISSIAQTFTPHVERMGLDENFLDITDKVQESYDTCSSDIVGYFYGHETVNQVPQSDPCGCGCYRRLIVGTQIACNLRKEIFEKTGITCCAGIAHNKVLAKMVSGYRKPNQQTVIFPWQVCELMSSLDHVKSVPGIGNVTTKNLEELNISSVQDLQRTDMKILRTKFDEETCKKLKNLSYGVDEGLVRGSVRPQSLGIEDAFTVTKVTSYEIIKSKYEALLERLLKLLAEDGRIPSSLKVVVRKSDGIVKFGPRESKQIPLSGSFFSKSVNNISENTKSSLYSLIISAFHKMVEVNKPFCLTLVGLGFTKLIEQPSEKKSIAQFFKKRPHDHLEETKIEVEEQKLVKIHRNKVYTSVEGQEFQASNIGEDIDDDNCDSDGEFSVRFNGGSVEMASESNLQQKCDIASNSNLQEQEKLNDNTINLGLDDSRLDHNHGGECSSINSSSVGEQNGESSHNPSIDLDPDVFNSLPKDIQEEVLMNFKVNSMYFGNKSTDSKVPNSIPHAKKINRQSLESYFKPGLKQLPLNSVPEKTNENSTEDEKDVLTKNNPCEIPETEASPSSLNKMDKTFENLDDERTLIPEQHQRTILHFDIDCFYAQVEMVLNPSLQGKPVGIKQKEIMITCNYVARGLGVKKSMFASEALKLLPGLILVDGSDLTHYRRFSTDITKIVQTFSSCVERLGLDENYLDVTERVSQCLDRYDKEIYGHWYGDKEENQMPKCDPCGCGCYERLIVGSHIAREVREAIFDKTGITCCAGIAHNKLIAKMVSGYHKPNDQTLIFPWQVCDLMNSLKCIKSIPGIGTVTNKALNKLGVSMVQELQNVPMKNLRTKFDVEMAKKLKEWSFGIDESPVRGTVLPQSIGLEDTFKIETSFTRIKVKYKTLLERLLKLLAIDGREPSVMKVSARKFDMNKRYGHRDSKQVPLSSSFFSKGVGNISENAKSAMLDIIIKTFQKLVDVSKPFELTMVGLGMTKFVNQVPNSKSIIQFLQKTSSNIGTRQDYRKEEHESGKTILSCSNSGVSERDLELQEMKIRKESASSNRNCEQKGSFSLGSGKESKNNIKQIKDMNSLANMTDTKAEYELCCKYGLEDDQSRKDLVSRDNFPSLPKEVPLSLSDDIDLEVYKALPKELQEEILSWHKRFDITTSQSVVPSTSNKDHSKISCQTQKVASIEGYLLVKESVPEKGNVSRKESLSDKSVSDSSPSCSSSSNTLNVEYKDVTVPIQADVCKTNTETGMQINGRLPDGIDLDVFRELPKELQKEVLEAHQGYKKISSPTKSTKLLLKKRKKVQEPSILKYLKRS